MPLDSKDPDNIDESALVTALSEIVEAHREGGPTDGTLTPTTIKAKDAVVNSMGKPDGADSGTAYTITAGSVTDTNMLLKLISYAIGGSNVSTGQIVQNYGTDYADSPTTVTWWPSPLGASENDLSGIKDISITWDYLRVAGFLFLVGNGNIHLESPLVSSPVVSFSSALAFQFTNIPYPDGITFTVKPYGSCILRSSFIQSKLSDIMVREADLDSWGLQAKIYEFTSQSFDLNDGNNLFDPMAFQIVLFGKET